MTHATTLLFPLFLVAVLVWALHQQRSARALLDDWAQANHLRILRRKQGIPPFAL